MEKENEVLKQYVCVYIIFPLLLFQTELMQLKS